MVLVSVFKITFCTQNEMGQGHKKGKGLKTSVARIYPDFPKVLPGLQICRGKPNDNTKKVQDFSRPPFVSELTSKLTTPFDLFLM